MYKVGAPAISEYLTEKYGRNSMALYVVGLKMRAGRTDMLRLIDEGSGLKNVWGQQFAMPGVAEKASFLTPFLVASDRLVRVIMTW